MFDDHPEGGTRVDIMRATYRALQKHGYAGLSIQRIADETDLSKSTFYHHYEGKDDLLLSFLEFTLGQFLNDLSRLDTGDPRRDLRVFFDAVLFDTHPDEVTAKTGPDGDCPHDDSTGEIDREAVKATVIELRAHAVRDGRYREQFTAADERMRDQLADIIARGVEGGQFHDVDVTRTADLLLTLAFGALLRPPTADVDAPSEVRDEIRQYVDDRLLAS
ncbi:MAG: TetR/AcrR family transcriptional regulator [Haloarculaceae archaeon]